MAYQEISKYRHSRFTDCESLPCTSQASNCSIFLFQRIQPGASTVVLLRVKSSENVESVAVVNCCHLLMGLCEVVLRYALKLQIWNMRLCQRFSSCGPQVAVRDSLSLDISSKLCVSGSNSPGIISVALLHACR